MANPSITTKTFLQLDRATGKFVKKFETAFKAKPGKSRMKEFLVEKGNLKAGSIIHI